MKNLVTALAILGVAMEIMAIQAAQGADLKDPFAEPAYEAPTYAFTGLAVGIDGGGQFTAIDINADYCDEDDCTPFFDFDGISADGLIGGGHLEYLFAVDRARFGAYAEGGFSNVNTTLEFHPAEYSAELQQDHYYGVGLKAGVTVYGDTLVYARGGYDWSQWTASDNDIENPDVKSDVGAWLIGGGIDTMISERASLGVGVDYLIVNDVESAGEDLTELFEDSEIIRAKARLSYHF